MILPLYSVLMRGRTGPSHKSMSLQAVERSVVQDSVKCSAHVQVDDDVALPQCTTAVTQL